MIRVVGMLVGAPFIHFKSAELKREPTDSELALAKNYREKVPNLTFDLALAPMAPLYNDSAAIIAGLSNKDEVEHMDEFYFDPEGASGDILRSIEHRVLGRLEQSGPFTLGSCLSWRESRCIDVIAKKAADYLLEDMVEMYDPQVVLIVGPKLVTAAMGYELGGGHEGPFAGKFHAIDLKQHSMFEIVYTGDGKTIDHVNVS